MFTAGVEAELVPNLLDVVLSSALGDEEPLGDLAIRESVGDKLCTCFSRRLSWLQPSLGSQGRTLAVIRDQTVQKRYLNR